MSDRPVWRTLEGVKNGDRLLFRAILKHHADVINRDTYDQVEKVKLESKDRQATHLLAVKWVDGSVTEIKRTEVERWQEEHDATCLNGCQWCVRCDGCQWTNYGLEPVEGHGKLCSNCRWKLEHGQPFDA